jgi:hypothetical protein
MKTGSNEQLCDLKDGRFCCEFERFVDTFGGLKVMAALTNRRTFLRDSLAAAAGITAAALPASSQASCAPPFIAFSMREAQRRAQANSTGDELMLLAGISRICGIVQDDQTDDVILVGAVIDGQPKATLDDVVIALRARLRLDQWPTVSIDPNVATPKTRVQQVSFYGGLKGTSFGRDFLATDIILKEYSLGRLRAAGEVLSFKDWYVGNVKAELQANSIGVKHIRWIAPEHFTEASRPLLGREVNEEESCQCRFWFYPRDPVHFFGKGCRLLH